MRLDRDTQKMGKSLGCNEIAELEGRRDAGEHGRDLGERNSVCFRLVRTMQIRRRS